MNTKTVYIQGYEGLYQITTKGDVISLPKSNGNGNKTRVLKQGHRRKYLKVTLSKNGVTHTFAIHRLVGQHFIPNPENKPFINHKDNDPKNNNVENLEWVTAKENMQHSEIQGRQLSVRAIATKKAAEAARRRTLEKLSTIPEITNVKYEIKPGNKRGTIHYQCAICGNKYSVRTDSTRFITKNYCDYNKDHNYESLSNTNPTRDSP